MGFIQIENMEFYAYHGHYKEERVVGSRFLLNITLKTNLSAAANSDKIEDALNYQIVYQLIKEEMQNHKSHLLEHIGKRIINRLRNNFDTIEEITLKISKMNPSLGGQVEKVSITMCG